MKKRACVLILLSIFLISSFAFADINDSDTASETTSDSTEQQQDSSKIDKAFECLEKKVKSDCSGVSTIQELALTILASPEEITNACVSKLKSLKKSDNCWGDSGCTVKDTALTVLALNHVGQNTDESEDWLLSKNKTSTELIWYLEQDSNEASQCKISYSGNDHTINVAENKKIDSSAGSCLSLAQSNFWLQVSPNCYDKEFQVSCDKDFIATLLYRQQNSPTIYILSDTESEPSFGTISLKIKSKCFSTTSSCNYEDSAWATLALLETGHDIEEFLPYLIALADSNKKYLPKSFIYMISNYDDYGTQLIQEQRLGNYWEADSSAHNRFYDTALALLALTNSNAEQVIKAKDWLLFSQDSDGCWNTNREIRDTAIILWALEGRGFGGQGQTSLTYCSEAGFFCIPTAECPENQKLENYFCSGLSTVCCQSENLLTCSEYSGQECSEDEFCTGNERKSSNTDNCCLADCEPRPQTSECEDMGYICKNSCSENQEEISYTCESGEICCRTKTTPPTGSRWWIWLLIILILIVIGVIIFLLRHRLKLFWFKIKSRFKKDKGKSAPAGPGTFPPRPGFPPIRRQPMQMRRPLPQQRGRTDSAMDNVFKKLKDMAK